MVQKQNNIRDIVHKNSLRKVNLNYCITIKTSLENKVDYAALNKSEITKDPCKNLIGCQIHLMVCTCPDLSFSVNILSRFANNGNHSLWSYLKRVLRYLKGSIDLQLTSIRSYRNNDNILSGFVYSDLGSDEVDRKGTTGYLIKLKEQCTICWNTKRQLTVVVSSTEAECSFV